MKRWLPNRPTFEDHGADPLGLFGQQRFTVGGSQSPRFAVIKAWPCPEVTINQPSTTMEQPSKIAILLVSTIFDGVSHWPIGIFDAHFLSQRPVERQPLGKARRPAMLTIPMAGLLGFPHWFGFLSHVGTPLSLDGLLENPSIYGWWLGVSLWQNGNLHLNHVQRHWWVLAGLTRAARSNPLCLCRCEWDDRDVIRWSLQKSSLAKNCHEIAQLYGGFLKWWYP